jgi:manganese transport protein
MAIIPAALTIIFLGEEATGRLLILSQVILSLQLGFAIIPLIHFVSDKRQMKEFAIGKLTKFVAWIIAGIIVILNGRLIIGAISQWMQNSPNPLIIQLTIVPVTLSAGIVLLYITIQPLLKRIIFRSIRTTHPAPPLRDISAPSKFNRIAIAIDFSEIDSEVIRYGLSLANPESKLLIIHVVESAGARLYGKESLDFEAINDRNLLNQYQTQIRSRGADTNIFLGFGNPGKIISDKTNEFNADLLVMGAHGHKGLKDIIFGTIVDKVRHRVKIPVFIVKEGK